MFFKRGREGKSGSSGSKAGVEPSAGPLVVAVHPEPLAVGELRKSIDPASLGFTTTADIEPISGLIGQDRALRAIEFGANMKANDFNIFVLGPPASGKTTAVRAFLTEKAGAMPAPTDWVYVYNFENPNRPRALQLPVGRARLLEKGMVAAIDELTQILGQSQPRVSRHLKLLTEAGLVERRDDHGHQAHVSLRQPITSVHQRQPGPRRLTADGLPVRC